ncbi:hypothetical protein [Haloarcula nitratireducens]|uniref:Uncharacterized protein n=1 Tax=Haloarcula nitratireducens TaxID=2487749 RepID=A0AAW4PEC6_9EURY|nr:hypothetical protein [Halomicroarcula nitratireducens]MBX0296274.1 hypothetical protein [Halomicroarcula nitratireducens]
MDSRLSFDLVLVVLAALLSYTETFGFADPRATIYEIIGVLLGLDIRVYLVLGGMVGMSFVAYLVVYLPQKAARSAGP